jgi:Deoxynucleoside kinase
MIISFEGLPSSRKAEIYDILYTKYGINVKRYKNDELYKSYRTDIKKYVETYQYDRLQQLIIQYEMEGHIYNSLHSNGEVYLYLLQYQNIIDKVQADVLSRFYKLFYKPPTYIIYLYGDLEKCFNRMEKQDKIPLDEYKTLHYQYEWVFDITNCKIPVYKVNIDDTLDMIITNIVDILNKIDPTLFNITVKDVP